MRSTRRNYLLVIKDLAKVVQSIARPVLHPRAIRNAVFTIDLCHTAFACLFLHNWLVFFLGVVLCYLCKVLQPSALSAGSRFLRTVVRVLLNLFTGGFVAFEDHLDLVFSHSGLKLPTFGIAVAIGLFLSLVDHFADELHRTYSRRELLSNPTYLFRRQANLDFEIQKRDRVRIELHATPDASDPVTFLARLYDSNNDLVKRLKVRGTLGLCEKLLDPGKYHIIIVNRRPSGLPLRVVAGASVAVKEAMNDESRPHEEPLDISALKALDDDLAYANVELHGSLMCPTNSRSFKPVDEAADNDGSQQDQEADGELSAARVCRNAEPGSSDPEPTVDPEWAAVLKRFWANRSKRRFIILESENCVDKNGDEES